MRNPDRTAADSRLSLLSSRERSERRVAAGCPAQQNRAENRLSSLSSRERSERRVLARGGGAPRALNKERGAALLLALISAALIAAIAASLIVSTSTDLMITGSYRSSLEAMYGVEAGVERAIGELATVPDWSVVLAAPPSNVIASFDDGSAFAAAPDGRRLSVPGLTAARQAVSNTVYGPTEFGADSPAWRLYAHAPLQSQLSPGLIAPPGYILVWVADDGEDGDGDPTKDSNGQLLVYGDAYGVSGSRRAVEIAIARAAPTAIRVLSWKDPR
jgi:hypothetical protein